MSARKAQAIAKDFAASTSGAVPADLAALANNAPRLRVCVVVDGVEAEQLTLADAEIAAQSIKAGSPDLCVVIRIEERA